MPAEAADRRRARRGLGRGWRGVMLCALCLGAPAAHAEGAGIQLARASVHVDDGVYLLDAAADIRLSRPVRRALDNGVVLTFDWQIDIRRARAWWLDAEVATVAQRYTLQYHDLSLQYLVTNGNTGERRSFTRLPVALDFIGRLIGFPLVDRMLLDESGEHTGYVRLLLKHDTLPLPLRPEALLSPSWYLQSDWQSWSLD